MTTMHSEAFDVIPYEDIKGNWKKLGSGSFGNVYKGSYLGLDVAIKEVLPSNDYDVAKYFEREWRLMKECRHPNICLFIGLSRAPEPDNRIFIISEFVENGNVRSYIHNKTKHFPWRLRISFATDVARALAYLHARKCIHRDLKGENLLVTENGRLKITDFGFARIAARNAEESKRLTFCGTDSYMSPEILVGDEFDLPTDVFSLGIIFCEIAARTLADDNYFKRYPPAFEIDQEEVRNLADTGCPSNFVQLCLDCLSTDPSRRPNTREILDRLRVIEAEVLLRPSEEADMHFGSIKLMSNGKRLGGAPRIPNFNMGEDKDKKGDISLSDDSDEEFIEAISALSSINNEWDKSTDSQQPLLNLDNSSSVSEYSTTVVRGHPQAPYPPSLSSILTVRPFSDPNETLDPIFPATPLSDPPSAGISNTTAEKNQQVNGKHLRDLLESSSMATIASYKTYHTAPSLSVISTALATEGGSTIRTLQDDIVLPLVHRFTLLKPGAKPKRNSGSGATAPNNGELPTVWNPLELFFSSGLLVAKCDVCMKRLGWKPVLECDDCGLRAHVKCGEVAPTNCGTRVSRPGFKQPVPSFASPLSKVKQVAGVGEGLRTKSPGPPRR